ncbi:MAG: chromosome segregation protein SMC [Bdellovibrionia bacterium]
MRVKRLEIQGFKSFKDKTVIHFDHSITGIIGPNGCGKSNIVDAFFWVMGEQSYKHMRGSSSEDLIFNGSSKYSSLGLAEATLVMETDVIDNENAPAGASAQDLPTHLRSKEISVTRRVYRTGEGEYFINGTSARLKDIHELFMDTGVGAKGYSVIEQGQIGKIVNSKPEERRLLIEEAAGIAKYKARKKESLKKMEATQANLSRLTDIIQEIEKTLASLERQAAKARHYKKYKEELFDLEISWGSRKHKIYQRKLESLRLKKEALEQDLEGVRAELQTAENTIEIDRIALVTETKDAEMLQAKIQDLADNLSHERSALELSRQRKGDLTTQLQSLRTEQTELESAVSSDQLREQEMKKEGEEADVLFQQISIEVKEMNAALAQLRSETEASRSQMNSSQQELRSTLSQISELTSKASGLLSKAESAQAQTERLGQQIEGQVEKLTLIREEKEKFAASSIELKDRRESLQAERKQQAEALQSDEQNVKALDKEREQSHRALTQFKSKLQSLEELDAAHEGLADGPKAALDWAKANGKSDRIQPLTDALTVNSGYEFVLQSWLENRIEGLISNDETADATFLLPLLEQIRNDKQGRVSIQLLSENPPRGPLKTLGFPEIRKTLEEQGFTVLGELSEFVSPKKSASSQPGQQDSLARIIDSVCVVESSTPLDSFLKSQALSALSGWAIVTMDGVVLESDGLLRGGSLESSGIIGILRRKHAIEELKIQVTAAETKHSELESGLAAAKQNLELLRARKQATQEEFQTLEIEYAALQRDIHQTDRALQEAQSHLTSIQQDHDEMKNEEQRAIEDREEIEYNLKDLIASRVELEETLSQSEGILSEQDSNLRTKETELQTIRIKEVSLRERSISLKRELEAVKSLISDRQRRLVEIGRTLERASLEQAQHTGGESNLAEKIEELAHSLANSREELASVKDRIEQLNARVNGAMEHIKTLHKGGDRRSTEANQIALEIEKLSSDLSHLIINMEEKYGPGCLNRVAATLVAGVAAGPMSDFDSQDEIIEDGGAVVDQEEQEPVVAAPVEEIEAEELSAEEELELSEKIEKLRERIRRLGEVNVMAIEEHEQLKKRYDHLISEKADLDRSLTNLQAAIQHINKTSEERYKKAFEAIAERFEKLFPVVFGGGSAQLSLVYPENSTDILEAGVDILAQPPGKKVSNITLLSGGEKALTAVSLIFAIFMVKPSPFCVLDEVDAPLDDANIGKFNALLKEMSAKSQFILITHNKKTMELNDTLYGVTMEEPGVSKMVSIELH